MHEYSRLGQILKALSVTDCLCEATILLGAKLRFCFKDKKPIAVWQSNSGDQFTPRAP